MIIKTCKCTLIFFYLQKPTTTTTRRPTTTQKPTTTPYHFMPGIINPFATTKAPGVALIG